MKHNDDERPFAEGLVSDIGPDELSDVRQRLIAHLGAQQFIGSAPAFWATIKKIPSVASCDATVLLVGDTGTGKELCARAIHYFGARASKPFVPINCGSMPPALFENELFGHEQGAFTDARQSRRGLIAETEGGTLFFDEVDSLPLSAQVKLLRFLQERQYRPLGGHYRHADVRVIAATNQNLLLKMHSGAFREDLYYRLKVVTLHLPPLRERKEDILPLAIHFLKTSAHEYKRPEMELSAGAMNKLTSYTWPGNIRELENVIRQAVVLAAAPTIRARDLQFEIEVPVLSEPFLDESFQDAKARMIEEFERTYLENALVANAGNISKAARHARKDRRSFFALLKKYSLVPSQRGLSERQSSAHV
jgi:DNA-binding NtrC family response regulator